jgi:hypothetical protein
LKSLSADDHQQRILITIVVALLNPSDHFSCILSTFFTYQISFVPVRIKWDADRYAESIKQNIELHGETSASNASLEKFFPNPELGIIREPAVILDRHGRILIWVLPRILSGRLVCVVFSWLAIPDKCINNVQPDLEVATKFLKRQLEKTVDFNPDHDPIWRNDPKIFEILASSKFQAGSLDMSPSWFQQRKEVCQVVFYLLLYISTGPSTHAIEIGGQT